MKSKRRHELQQNQLADWMARRVDQVRPYSGAMAAAMVLLAGGVFLFWLIGGWSQRQATAAWDNYFGALRKASALEDLQSIAETYDGSNAAMFSRLRLATYHQGQGLEQRFIDPDQSRQHLRTAAEQFTQVLSGVEAPTIRQFAMYQLARCYESLGQLDQARQQYGQLVEAYPESAFGDRAKTWMPNLNTQATVGFYRRYTTATRPSPAAAPLDSGKTEEPDIDLDRLPDDPESSNVAPPPTDDPAPAPDDESTDDAAPSDAAPSDAAPSDAAPSDAAPSDSDPPQPDDSKTPPPADENN
jgi:tetratricopeptide (TPR) repeat protein